jgi:hypothetical protein
MAAKQRRNRLAFNLEEVKLFYVNGLDRFFMSLQADACGYRIKPHGQLVSVSLTHYCASTPDLSTSWSRTNLQEG